MPRLHLVLPEKARLEAILPPDVLQALERRVSRGDTPERIPSLPQSERAPLGAISRQQDCDDAGEAHWARLTPVTLQPDMAGVGLVGLPPLDGASSEAIWGLAREVLEPFGWRCLPDPAGGAWLRSEASFDIDAVPPESALGMDVGDRLPAGPGARRWQQAAGALEIELHHAEINRERARRGEPPVNALWLWGCGTLADAPATAEDGVWMSDDPWRRRLARWMGWRDRRQSAPRPPADDEASLWVDFHSLADQRHLPAWLAALPSLQRSGLVLHRAGASSVQLESWHRLRFWR